MRTFNNQDLKDVEKSFFEPGKKVVEVPMILEKGQVSFHHCLTIHGSYPNFSDRARMAFALYLQDYDNRYQVYKNQGKQVHHFLDNMCRKLSNGNPDYSDPEIFPTLWCE